MRTKALLCAAAIAAGAISAVAQNNVYSLNVVGYVNVNVPVGYSILANPLSAGVTNGANEIMPVIPDEQILTWNGAGYNAVQYSSLFGAWVNPATLDPANPPSLPPGKGFFFYNPGAATTVTFVGQVVPGPGTTNSMALPVGYSMIGSPLPVSSADITASPSSLPVVPDMQILKWTGAGYTAAQYSSLFAAWVNPATLDPVSAPSVAPGEGFFFYTPTATAWNQSLP